MRDPLPFLTPVGAAHLYTFGLLIPYLSIRSYFVIRKAPQRLPDRVKHFRTTAILLVAFGVFSVLTAGKQHIELFHADARGLLRSIPAAVAMYVLAVLFMRPRW